MNSVISLRQWACRRTNDNRMLQWMILATISFDARTSIRFSGQTWAAAIFFTMHLNLESNISFLLLASESCIYLWDKCESMKKEIESPAIAYIF